jgi:Peptidase A4 family
MAPPFRLAALAVLAASLAAPASAGAASSSNWAGYVAHAPGMKFRTVRGAWTVPSVDCSHPRRSYSATWIGLGGYHSYTNGLEQTGTEADCHNGIPRYGAWLELIPDAEHKIPLAVRGGDRITARVSVKGRLAAIRLSNLTTGRTYRRTLVAPAIDTTSAEWIVEAPSSCDTPIGPCRVLRLANFGTTTFTSARAVTTGGHQGVIGDRRWTASPIDLSPSVIQIGTTEDPGSVAGAQTGALTPSGTSFTVTYVPES